MKHLYSLLSNIQSGITVRHTVVSVQRTRLNLEVLNLLYSEGFINGFSISEKKPNNVSVFLKYSNGNPVLRKFKIISIPSKRVYVNHETIVKDLVFKGVFVLTTSKYGLIISEAFRKNSEIVINTGGELLFQIIF